MFIRYIFAFGLALYFRYQVDISAEKASRLIKALFWIICAFLLYKSGPDGWETLRGSSYNVVPGPHSCGLRYPTASSSSLDGFPDALIVSTASSSLAISWCTATAFIFLDLPSDLWCPFCPTFLWSHSLRPPFLPGRSTSSVGWHSHFLDRPPSVLRSPSSVIARPPFLQTRPPSSLRFNQ